MAIPVIEISAAECDKIISLAEGHFADLKDIRIAPAKLTRTLSALSNAEGGEVYVGISETSSRMRSWNGFNVPEDANGHIQAFEQLFPLGEGYGYMFLKSAANPGHVLKIEVAKSRDVKKASDGGVYVRRGAQNLPVTTSEALTRLQRNKGLLSFETEPVNADSILITNSTVAIEFMLEVVPTGEPAVWLRKQQVIQGDKPTVAGLVLFAEEPQAVLPKRSGIKIYRYQTAAAEGTRETLAGDPISIEGHAYKQIHDAVSKTAEIVESVRVNTSEGLGACEISHYRSS